MRSLLLISLLFTNYLFAQVGMGEWRMHVPNRNAISIQKVDNTVFTAFEKGLMEYDIPSKEMRLWTAVNGLSDVSISTIHFHSGTNSLVIAYENGNIDFLKNGQVTNLPAIKLAQISGNKKIYKICEYGSSIYLATGFGIVVVNPQKREVRDTWYPSNGLVPIRDVAFRSDSVFALAESGLYTADILNPAIPDYSQWSVDGRVPFKSGFYYDQLENVQGKLLLTAKKVMGWNDSLYLLEDLGLQPFSNENYLLKINSIQAWNDKIIKNTDDVIYVYNMDGSVYTKIASWNIGTNFQPYEVSLEDSDCWVADYQGGLLHITNASAYSYLRFQGPPKETAYSMDAWEGKVVVASGGLNGIDPTYNSDGVYVFENETWSLFDPTNMPMWQGTTIWDFLSVSIDPTNSNRLAVGTYSPMPLSLLATNGLVTDTFTPLNSAMKYTDNINQRGFVSALKYDTKGNLWIVMGSENPLTVRTAAGEWYAMECGTEPKNKFPRKLAIDYKGNKWFSVGDIGIIGLNDNNTISDTGDDKIVLLNTGATTGNLPSSTVTAIAVDFDNEIWIGTDNGFAVLYNAENAFDASAGNYNAQQIKLNYETNVEYVLSNTAIVDIEVDGGNRKWMATANAGLILLSADGTKILEQLTMDNSPLISNSILDIQMDQKSGELFIATDKGLISYRTDASYEDASYASTQVFPNPVRPGYNGPVTIQGIRYDSDVKVTDVSGKLVYQTTSNGGTATWDCKSLDGMDVSAGVYLIWTAANEGKGRLVGKVLIMR